MTTLKMSDIQKFVDDKRSLTDIITAVKVIHGLTQADAKNQVTALLSVNGIELSKSTSMKDELYDWIASQASPFSIDPKRLQKAAEDLGMTEISAKWYVRQYLGMSEVIAKVESKKKDKK